MKNIAFSVLLVLMSLVAEAQPMPVHFTVTQKQVSAKKVDVVFSATIDNGWHVYSTNLPADGPIAATLHAEVAEGVKAMGGLVAKGKETSEYDPMFGATVRYFEHAVTFVQSYAVTSPSYRVKGYLEYGACNDRMCLPPMQVEFEVKAPEPSQEGDDKAAAVAAGIVTDQQSDVTATDDGGKTMKDSVARDSMAALTTGDDSATVLSSDLWQPVIRELGAYGAGDSEGSLSLWYVFVMGLLGGVVALFTPCVWPVIPMTVSFFLKRTKEKRKAVGDAVTYGIAIIVIYMLLALLLTALFGPQTLNDLATNAPFNIFFCLLLIVFALSFFGWFEITLPPSIANKVDSKASATSGLLSIFLMAFTLALVSFSCTGPIIGFLLVDFATTGNWLAPAVGMFGFAVALALPFTLFALFPSWVKKAPKSGAWMNTLKVVLGFIELAFACKFLSVADLAYGWHLMDREVFLSIWIAIFTAMALYLFGVLRFQSDGERRAMPVACIVGGMASLAFAIYMVPGLWGAPCKAVSAFAPPMYTQDFNLYPQQVEAAFTDYDRGMAAAKAQGKPVVVDFTGFGCVNCRKMEASVWTDPAVAERLTRDYVLISLYVDDKTPLPQPLVVTASDGTRRTLRTVGDKWSWLQQSKFGFLAQPFYVTLDNQGKPLSGSFAFNEDPKAFATFLDSGLKTYRQHR